MRLYPAIDIKDGKCVRLKKGLFNEVTVYSDKPYEIAESFEADGAKFIHTVDLDGARGGHSVNSETIKKIVDSVSVPVQLGGGIRTLEDIETVLNLGIYRAIIGTKAVENPDFIRQAIENFGAEHIVVGIDAKNGMVATEGWLEKSDVSYLDLGLAMEDAGVKTIIFTDISRDGTLTGVNTEQLGRLNETVSCNIIASGGVSSIKDIEDCLELNLYGCICGKALYTGALNLEEAVRKAGVQTC